MAPKTGTKRAASTTTHSAKAQKKAEEKKVKQVPKQSDPLMEGVIDTIHRAELPKDSKEMLLQMLPGCFSDPVEDRHEFQTLVVGMVGEVIEQMRGQITKDVEEASSALQAAEAKKTSMESTVLEAESQLTTAREVVQTKEAELRDASKLASEKQTLLDNAKDAQIKGDAEFEEVRVEKETFVSAFTDSFKLLRSSDLEGQEAVQHYKVIQPIAAKLELDEALLMALPSTCQKKPCNRGSFDNVIMEQCEKALQAHIDVLQQKFDGGASAAAERAASVQAAEQEFNAAKEAKDTADEELRGAEAKQQAANQHLESSKQAASDLKLEIESLTKARSGKIAVGVKFEDWNLSCFKQLRDKSRAPKQEATPAAAPEDVTVPKDIVVEPADVTVPKDMVVDAPKPALVMEAGA